MTNAALDEVQYDFVEVFAGRARVSKVFREARKSAAALDLAYDSVVGRKGGMDLATPAGFAKLGCIRERICWSAGFGHNVYKYT